MVESSRVRALCLISESVGLELLLDGEPGRSFVDGLEDFLEIDFKECLEVDFGEAFKRAWE